MTKFQYEWHTIDIRFGVGTITCEYKGKNKDVVIKHIKREYEKSNSVENMSKPIAIRKQPMIEIFWNTLKLDRVGYKREF